MLPLLRCFLSALLLLLANGAMVAEEAIAQDSTEKVLLLNSYHPGYAWSDKLQTAIVETIQNRNPNWLPYIEYLDCKRFPGGEHLEELVALFQSKYEHLSLVIAMDDPALEFALKNRTTLFEHSPVLFCGINDFTPAMLHGQPNVTGRAENIDIAGTLELMLRLHPGAREIFVLNDYTVSSLATRNEVEELILRFPPGVRFRFIEQLDMEDVLKGLERLPEDCLVLVIGFTTDKAGRAFGVSETTGLFVKHSPVPVYSAFEARLGHGIIGGKLIDAKVHGARTGNMALRILGGEKPSDIPIETESDAQFMFDYAALARFSIPVEALPKDSIVINQPISFYATHRSVIHFALSSIVVLCAIIGLLTVNIIQRRRAISALGMSEERFRLAFENANDGVCLVDNEGRLIRVNKRMCDIFGYGREELEGMTVNDLAHPEDLHKSPEFMQQSLKGEIQSAVFEKRYFHKDGHLIYGRVSTSAIRDPKDGVLCFISHVQDITKRKRVEDELRESDEKFRMMFHTSPIALSLSTLSEGRYLDVNQELLRLAERSREEMIGHTAAELNSWVHEGQRESILSKLKEHGRVTNLELDLRSKSGQLVQVLWSAEEVVVGGERCLLTSSQNITDIKRSEERFRYLIENAPDAIFVRIEDRFVYVNPAMLRLLGASSPDQLIGQRVLDWIHPDGRAASAERMKQTDSMFKPLPLKSQKYLSMEGTVVDVEALPVPLVYEGRKAALVFMRDITERKRAEEEQARMHALLQQAQKMEAIGTLAGGIAHDFNNILSVILGNAEMAMPDIPDSSPAQYSLGQIVKAGYRARDLVGQILAFSRQTESERKPIKVGSIAKEVLRFLRASLPTTIEIRTRIEVEQDIVLADPTQIHQVLMNLCTNAHHAMLENGGVLEVALSHANGDSATSAKHPGLQPGTYLKLCVSDTGCGMSPEVMKRIFDPYFTTKGKTVGTGLGLAVVHGIVKDLGGEIHAESEPGEGSRFEIFLPTADEKVIPEIRTHSSLPRGDERILFVDDEEGVVDLGKRMLQHLGYEVEVRTSSMEALAEFREKPERFDLVITDITMPNMTGDKLAKELIGIRSDIPIIICTGYSERISDERAAEMGVRAFVMKPILMREMAIAIRLALETRNIRPCR